MDSLLNLQARVKRCRPAHTLMGFFFQGALEHLEHLIGEGVAEEIREKVPCTREPLLPVLFYPVSDYLKLLQLGARALVVRGRSFPAAMEALGYGSAQGLFSSSMGRMVLAAGEKTPHGGLAEVPSVARMVTSFGKREYQQVAEDRGRLVLRGEFPGPSWATGMYRAGLERMTGRACTIEVAPSAFVPYLDFALELHW